MIGSDTVYTLDALKNMIESGRVNGNNYQDVLASLTEYNFNDEVADLLLKLSSNESIPASYRDKLKDAVLSYKAVISSRNSLHDSIDTAEDDEITQMVFPEPIKNDSEVYNSMVVNKTVSIATQNGLTVNSCDISKSVKPSISFEIKPDSKPYIDHLLLDMYGSDELISVELSKIKSNNLELLTISVDDRNMNDSLRSEVISNTFNKINEVIETTDRDKDYEALMSDDLRQMKSGFVNDQVDVDMEDYRIGYSSNEGVVSYYVIASSKEKAEDVVERLGYELNDSLGGNTYSIKAKDNMKNSKLDKAASLMEGIDEVKQPSIVVDNPIYKIDNALRNGDEVRVISSNDTERGKFVEIKDNSNGAVEQLVVDSNSLNEYIPSSYSVNENGNNNNEKEVGKVQSKKLGTHPNFTNAAYASFYAIIFVVMFGLFVYALVSFIL